MKRKLNAIFIDGPRFSGKSSQTSVLSSYLKTSEIPFKKFRIDSLENIKEAVEHIGNTDEFTLIDGSITYYLCQDLVNQEGYQDIENKYINYLNKLRELSSSKNTLNIVLVPEDLDICENFYSKSKKMGLTTEDYYQANEIEILNCFRFVDNHSLTRDIKYMLFDFYKKDSILEIHNSILKEVNEGYYIK